MRRGAIWRSAETLCKDQVIKGRSSVSLFKWELLFKELIQSSDIPAHSAKLLRRQKLTGRKRGEFKEPLPLADRCPEASEVGPTKLRRCALHKRIYECITRGRNEPRKAHTNPPGGRQLFRIGKDTIHTNTGTGTFFLHLFKIHALNVKTQLAYIH